MDNGNPKTAKIIIDDKEYELPLVIGTEGEVGINILKFRQMSNGVITYDPGYGNTGSCRSAITFINGEEGILRYRGYNIEDLAENASFTEVMYLIIFGELPTKAQLEEFERDLKENAMLHEDMKKFFEGFPATAHPMAILSSMITALSTFHPPSENGKHDHREDIIKLLAKVKTIAAYSYKKSIGEPYIYPDPELDYVGDFLNMMFKKSPNHIYKVNPVVEKALNQLLILHADHEQNCSASTVRMVGSSKGNMYSAIAAGVSALWGPLHGGANQAVIEMLEAIQNDGGNIEKYVNMAKDKNSGFRLMGFGHRVYKNFDPRARILKKAADDILKELGVEDPLLDIAKKLEEVALNDEYFKSRRLYPNVDFYSGIIYRALGIPKNMFTVMFALGRLPGWIAQWKEMREDPEFRIHRPRQIYVGPTERKFVPIDERS